MINITSDFHIVGYGKKTPAFDLRYGNIGHDRSLQKPVSQETLPSDPKPVCSLDVDYGSLDGQAKALLDKALLILKQSKPKTPNFFNWDGTFDCKSATFKLKATTYDKLPHFLKRYIVTEHGDALSTSVSSRDGKENAIETHLLYDRLSLDKDRNNEKRPDADILARLLVALGHEVYGNLQTYIERIASGTLTQPIDRRTQEIKAFNASIDLIGRAIKAPELQKFDESFKNDLIKALEAALIRENIGLATWQAAPTN